MVRLCRTDWNRKGLIRKSEGWGFDLATEGETSPIRGKVSKVFEYSALATNDAVEGIAGNIVGIAGFEELDIGETLGSSEECDPLPFVEIDPPTVMMTFSVNDGPMAGREGDRVTSREIRERLIREARTNISIKLEDTGESTEFKVNARGAMQVAVVVEEMRREGFEVLVSRPTVIKKKLMEDRMSPLRLCILKFLMMRLEAVCNR